MKKINDRELRIFGLVFGVIIILVFGFYLPWLFDYDRQVWPWVASLVFWFASFFALGLLRVFYVAWMRVADIINKILTHGLLALVFYLLITPLGLVKRVKRYIILDSGIEKDTYRRMRINESHEHMKRVF